MAIKLPEILRKLEKILVKNNYSFNEGLSKTEIKAQFENINIVASNEIVDVYSWKNGLNDQGLETSLELFPLGNFFSLQEGIQIYQYYVGNNYWSAKLFPMFGAGNSEFFLIDCDPLSKQYERIFFFSFTSGFTNTPVSYYDNIQTLFLSVTKCYEENAYYFENADDPYFSIDRLKEISINDKYNPNSIYWKLINQPGATGP